MCRHPSPQDFPLIHPLPSYIKLLGPVPGYRVLSMLCIPEPEQEQTHTLFCPNALIRVCLDTGLILSFFRTFITGGWHLMRLYTALSWQVGSGGDGDGSGMKAHALTHTGV